MTKSKAEVEKEALKAAAEAVEDPKPSPRKERAAELLRAKARLDEAREAFEAE